MPKKETYLGYKSNVKGKLFEAILKGLLKKSGFNSNIYTNQLTKNQERIRGRGGTYDPDILGQFSLGIPFVNPLLIIGEAKYKAFPLGMGPVREFLGSYIDFSQFPRLDTTKSKDARYAALYEPRFNYCPILFSVKGFQLKAQGLMFAHGINFISYENSEIMNKIFELAEDLLKTLNLTKFERGDYRNLKDLDTIKDLRGELQKRSFNTSLTALLNYISGLDSLIGILDLRFPVHILYAKQVKVDLSKEVKIELDRKNKFILKSVSGRKYGEFSISTSFLTEYLKYSKNKDRLDSTIKQIDVIVNRKGRWEMKQLLINQENREKLIKQFLPEKMQLLVEDNTL